MERLLADMMGVAGLTTVVATLCGAPAECVVVTPRTGEHPRVDVWVVRPDGSTGYGWGRGPDLGPIVCRAHDGREAPDGTTDNVVNLFSGVV